MTTPTPLTVDSVSSPPETASGATSPRRRRPRTPGRSWKLLPAHASAWLYAFILVLPIYYLIVSSFKTNMDILKSPFALPTSLDANNFFEAWRRVDLGTALTNSAVITGTAAVLTLALAIPAAYGLSRSKGRVGVLVERLFAMGFLIPGFAALVPTVLIAIAMNLYHTRAFLIIFMPATALPLSVILLTQFMRAIPAELEESAMLDGANRWQVLLRIYLPLTMPGIATVTILNVLNFWNEYLFTLILGGADPAVRTAQVALPNLISQTNTEYGILAAGTLITLIPVYLAYMFASRQMENAMLQGAIKS